MLMPDACERKQHDGIVTFHLYTRNSSKNSTSADTK